ncbi:hypothetical protein J6590_015992 [Homalodisca vitripennis]|nr:hypothetical protein J6590_015992 [Homalodisca vitripennis]
MKNEKVDQGKDPSRSETLSTALIWSQSSDDPQRSLLKSGYSIKVDDTRKSPKYYSTACAGIGKSIISLPTFSFLIETFQAYGMLSLSSLPPSYNTDFDSWEKVGQEKINIIDGRADNYLQHIVYGTLYHISRSSANPLPPEHRFNEESPCAAKAARDCHVYPLSGRALRTFPERYLFDYARPITAAAGTDPDHHVRI